MSPAEAFPKAWPWITAVIGVTVLLLVFMPDHTVVGVLIICILVGLTWLFWWLNRPMFTFISVEKVLTIQDVEGKVAKLLRYQTARANHKGITEFWCRNISADGSIDNILIDDQAPFQVRKEAGDTQVCKRFDPPLRRGQIFETVLSYELHDSFQARHEGIIHVVEGHTRKVRLVVMLPEARKAKSGRTFLRYGGQVHKELAAPKMIGSRLEFETTRLKLGGEYCLEWDW